MRIVLHLPCAQQQHAAWLACALQMITGFRATIEHEQRAAARALAERTRPKGPDDTSRFVVANMLGCHVQTVGDREASMIMSLAERGREGFKSADELWVVLQAYPCWRGHRHLVVPTYRELRARFAQTRHRLRGRGYGFEPDADTVSVIAV
jgi:hypothetical protein